MDNIKIPFGLSKITYGNELLTIQADKAEFSAIPKYQIATGGRVGEYTKYFLVDYDVQFKVVLQSEDYKTLLLHYPNLKANEHGLYDDASNVSTDGKRLVVHPTYAGENKEFDICLWNAYISPENGFHRVYGKETDKFEVIFIGKPSNIEGIENSFFFIGDWTKVGDE